MIHQPIRAVSIAIASLCLVGIHAATAQSEPALPHAADFEQPIEMPGHNEQVLADALPKLSPEQTVPELGKIARLDLQKLCDSFPLNARCQTPETPAKAAKPSEHSSKMP